MRSERSVRPRRTLIERAKAGDEAYQSLVAEGHLDHYRREVAFVRSHASEWRRSAEEPRVPVSRLRSSTSSICVRRIWASRALVRWMVVRINRRAHRLPGGHQLGQFVGPKAFEACPLAEVWRPGYLGLHTDQVLDHLQGGHLRPRRQRLPRQRGPIEGLLAQALARRCLLRHDAWKRASSMPSAIAWNPASLMCRWSPPS